MKKVGLISLGCAKNLVDSENILGLLNKNYEITNSFEESDIIVVNTCGFIESSKKESIETIFESLSYGKKVVVTGCLVQRYKKELEKEIPEVDSFIRISDYGRFNEFLSIVDEDLKDKSDGVNDEFRIVSTGNFSAYIKIGDGCDNRCSYCAIPLIRGSYKSRDMNSIINEAKNLALLGYKEIVLIEQDTTKYGLDLKDNIDITTLLKELLKIKSLDFIRLLYLYPDEISDELIELIGSEPRLTPYFDIPIQHSETHVLKDMNRRGDKQFLLNLFNKIRKKVPNAVLRTTLLVGFPGETDEDIDNLINFIKEIKFDHLGCFTYSREEGTSSFDFPNQIDDSVKEKRKNRIMKEQQRISYKMNKKHIGEIMHGIVVGKENGYYLFRSYWNAPDDVDGKIFVLSPNDLNIGDILDVKITDAFVYDLMGEII